MDGWLAGWWLVALVGGLWVGGEWLGGWVVNGWVGGWVGEWMLGGVAITAFPAWVKMDHSFPVATEALGKQLKDMADSPL